jgi:hypothetical protein
MGLSWFLALDVVSMVLITRHTFFAASRFVSCYKDARRKICNNSFARSRVHKSCLVGPGVVHSDRDRKQVACL